MKRKNKNMKIGGLQKLTLVDYPGKIAAAVFLSGCNFRCPFCQNAELVVSEFMPAADLISETELFEYLDSKSGFIDGICISGGEPTLNLELADFIKKIRTKGYLIKLDSNGSNPEILSKLLDEKLIDYIAMDIKTSLDKYKKAIGAEIDLEKIKESAEIIKNSGIDYEFRTTIVPGLVEREDIEKIGQWLNGAKKIALQQFQNRKVLDKKFEKISPYPDDILKEFKRILEKYIERVELRI